MAEFRLSDSVKKAYAEERTVITADDSSEFILVSRMSEEELQEFIKKYPGIDLRRVNNNDKAVCTYNPEKDDERPFRIELGVGTFSRARLAIRELGDGSIEYVVVRKTKTDAEIKEKAPFFSRDQAIDMTKKELKIQDRLNELIANGVVGRDKISTAQSHKIQCNKKDLNQLYQFCTMADMGNAKNIYSCLQRLEKEDKIKLYTYMANTLILSVSKLHNANFFIRDIKPENFLLSSQGNIMLSDFGSSTYYLKKGDEKEEFNVSKACDREYYGPMKYLLSRSLYKDTTPKGIIEKNIFRDQAHDQWALGISLLEMWGGKTLPGYCADLKALNADYMQSSQKNSNISMPSREKFDEIIKKIMDCDDFKNIPEHIKTIISATLETDSENRKSLEEIIKPFLSDMENKEDIKPLYSELISTSVDSNLSYIDFLKENSDQAETMKMKNSNNYAIFEESRSATEMQQELLTIIKNKNFWEKTGDIHPGIAHMRAYIGELEDKKRFPMKLDDFLNILDGIIKFRERIFHGDNKQATSKLEADLFQCITRLKASTDTTEDREFIIRLADAARKVQTVEKIQTSSTQPEQESKETTHFRP